MNEVYRVGDDAVFIPGDEAGELDKVYGITDPKRQKAARKGVAAAIRDYLSDPEIVRVDLTSPLLQRLKLLLLQGGSGRRHIVTARGRWARWP